MHIKKNDSVIVLIGKDKGKTGKVLRALPKEDKVIVEGVNVRQVLPRGMRKSGEARTRIERSYPIHASNVRLAEKK